MTGCTFLRSWFVEQNRFAVDLAHQLVAVGALHVGMHALQREGSAPVVVEERGFPLGGVVTFGAGRNVSTRELLAMGIVVALLALFGCGLEVDVHHGGFEIRRLMAIDARSRTVCTQQWESCFRMIELRQLFPRFCGMTCLAAARASCRLRLLHALIELAVVRVGVATGATQIGPVINRRGRLQFGGGFVTIRTGHCNVLASQSEARFFVTRQ